MTVATAVETGNHIAGKRVAAREGRTFESRNPAHTGEVVGVFARSSAADVDAAVQAAREAFNGWRNTPWPRRAEIILRAAELLEARKEELARLMTREMGKVLTEARGDVQEAIDMGKFIAGEGRRAFGETVPSELRHKWAMTMRQPFGVVGCITPWNFPIAIPSWKIFPAVMAGNTVVLKPAEDTPLCALRFVEALEEAGLPAGVVNVVFGYGEEAGDAVVRHPDVRAIYFTGSVDTGRIVSETCGRLLKKCSLELGGKNAIVVLADANVELAVEGALWGAFGTSGQRCTASSRLIVQQDALDEFSERLVDRAAKLRLGDGLQENVDVGPVINETQLQRIHSYTTVGLDEGARLALGGEIARDGQLADGWFYRPTVFSEVTPSMRIAQEEIFGPTAVIMPVGSLDEALEAANSTQYGLS
ncbi:MAG: aldehyde dehydrogenase family protein, partial [Candidatus Dormibacteria bacterium]